MFRKVTAVLAGFSKKNQTFRCNEITAHISRKLLQLIRDWQCGDFENGIVHELPRSGWPSVRDDIVQ